MAESLFIELLADGTDIESMTIESFFFSSKHDKSFYLIAGNNYPNLIIQSTHNLNNLNCLYVATLCFNRPKCLIDRKHGDEGFSDDPIDQKDESNNCPD